MARRVCPWWVGYFLMNPLRRLFQDPEKILGPFVTKGMTVVDVGSGMGFFTVPMAGMVGEEGTVLAVDVQERMIHSLQRRAEKAGMAHRIAARTCPETSLNLPEFGGKVDFVLAFAVVHEVPDAGALFAEIWMLLKPGGRCLVAEPKGHTSAREVEEALAIATNAVGLRREQGPEIRGCFTALLYRG